MKNNHFTAVLNSLLIALALFFSNSVSAQQQNSFMDKVQFGGGVGLNFGSGYTDIFLSPSAIYNVNSILAVGLSLQGGYIASKNYYNTYTYGGSVIGLVNPIPQIQLSAEIEQLRINTTYKLANGNHFSDNFWNTGLYLGAGYRSNNVTIGVRYDVLHNDNKSIYTEAFMPFVRVYF
jgi:hypothetical protein